MAVAPPLSISSLYSNLLAGLHREEISQARLNTVRGIENLDRLDESLYQDFETEDMRKVSP